MPIYEYRCDRCEKVSEFFLKISDPHPDSCPACGAVGSLCKQISQTSFALKGDGWYVTDYKKPATAPAQEPEGAKGDAVASPTDGSVGGAVQPGGPPAAATSDATGKDSTPSPRTVAPVAPPSAATDSAPKAPSNKA
jgi:putative FmdB family regulatory protein